MVDVLIRMISTRRWVAVWWMETGLSGNGGQEISDGILVCMKD